VSAANTEPSQTSAATQAAEWFIELQAGEVSREQQEAFADWLRRSPLHVEEFLQLTALQGDLARLPEFMNLDVGQLLTEFNAAGGDVNVFPLPLSDLPLSDMKGPHTSASISSTRSNGQLPRHRRLAFGTKFRFAVGTAAALALIAFGLSSAGFIRDLIGRQYYQTGIGEQRSMTLVDGSQIQLNALSKLSTLVNTEVRDLQLSNGEALFRVAKDPAHPFRVHTPQAIIEAKGTQFNVEVNDGMTVVSLIEGRVLVTPPAKRRRNGEGVQLAKPVLLNAGEQLLIADQTAATPQPHAADMKTAIAWTQHRLVFEDAPLSEVIAEFNRYSREPFTVEDPTLRNLRITASFDSGSTQTFAEALAAAGDLRVIHLNSGGWLIERK